MGKHTIINLLCVCIVLLSYNTVFGQQTEAFQRIKAYYIEGKFVNASNEVDKIIANHPLNVEARYWQTRIALTRSDTLDVYNFNKILDNISFLRNLNSGNEMNAEIQSLISNYRKRFSSLNIILKDPPKTMFYTGNIRMKFVPGVTLDSLQRLRLQEINGWFDNKSIIYFNRYDEQRKIFYAQIPGFPVLPIGLGKYKVLINDRLDSLNFTYSIIRKNELALQSKNLNNISYNIPKEYAMILTNSNLPITNRGVFDIDMNETHNLHPILIETKNGQILKVNKKRNWFRSGIIWGSISLLTIFILVANR